jgi:integrase
VHSNNRSAKPCKPPLTATRLLDQVRGRIRYLHYSLRTEQAYVRWIRQFIRSTGLRHPRECGVHEIEAFLSLLANDRKVSASTHRQALHALLFLYKEVLDIDLPWLQEIERPQTRKRMPVVLPTDEVARVPSQLTGELGLPARLWYGIGLRLSEGLRLRVKDLDFERRLIRRARGKRRQGSGRHAAGFVARTFASATRSCP